MKISQQELLKALMGELGLTREAFSRAYENQGVTLRTLNNWLLPPTSKGVTKLSDGLYEKFSDDLMGLLDESFSKEPVVNGTPSPRQISFDKNGTTVYFPDIWLLDGYQEFTEEQLEHLTGLNPSRLKDGRYAWRELSLDNPVKDANFFITSSKVLTAATGMDCEPIWVHVQHFSTAREAVAAWDTAILLIDDDWMKNSCTVKKYNGQYFTFFTRIAPSWCENPLIIYSSKSLSKYPNGEITVDYWEKVIDVNGLAIPMPSKDEGLLG